ncbi:hypothetical protein C7N43_32930 [Sphingobacteriales bacterium UPWRP_1]|nr:hypothetical protein BVG80_01225 [Sphingobacteriales bacterium TSM_CSM]PSJ72701.1 hypothetical protein C7N43_32930 [Sphingobacteriales bacterium UPWRP_1]
MSCAVKRVKKVKFALLFNHPHLKIETFMQLKQCTVLLLFFVVLLLGSNQLYAQLEYTTSISFANQQLMNPRVWEAKTGTESNLQTQFALRGLSYPPQHIYIRAFKKEGLLEVWVQQNGGQYIKFKDYTVCVSGGTLGPKRRQGDYQVPEGYYYINQFNPRSTYFLSLGINYPNESDRILGGYSNLGGDIFIHGACMTAGCLPIGNDKIKEVYWLSVLAKDNGQDTIPVHIYPFKFDNFEHYQTEFSKYAGNPRLIQFWDNLKVGYDLFETYRTPPAVGVNSDGSYRYSQ